MKNSMATNNQRLVQSIGRWKRVSIAVMTPLRWKDSIRYTLLLCLCSTLISLAGVPILFSLTPAFAVPKGPAGQTCKTHGTTTVDAKEEGTGRAMKCTADYCTYDECETSGPNIGKCYTKTSYSNVRNCKAAARPSKPRRGEIAPVRPNQNAPVGHTPPKLDPRSQAPKVGVGGLIAPRGVEGEPATSAPTEQKDTTPAPK